MRVLWVSVAPFVKSGYGVQSDIWTQQLKALGHEVMCYSYRGLIGTSVMRDGIQIQPQGRMTAFGLEMVPHYYGLHGADVCITLTDLFIFSDVKEQMAASGMKFAHWLPIDCSPLGAPDYNILSLTGAVPIAMSRHGEAQLTAAGFDPLYSPHGVDTAFWVPPSHAQRAQAREALGLSDSTFVIGMNAANDDSHDRKAFAEQFAAFAAFHARHPDSRLYVHAIANRHPIGLDLESICRREGIEDAVLFSDPLLYNSGSYTAEMMREQFYWVLDLYTGAAKAEGFGVPLVEAQACAVPVVTTDASAMAEVSAQGLAGGYRVPCQKQWSTLHSSYWRTPLIADIEAAYEQFFLEWKRGSIADCRSAARQHALSYDTGRVTQEHWAPMLKELEERINA